MTELMTAPAIEAADAAPAIEAADAAPPPDESWEDGRLVLPGGVLEGGAVHRVAWVREPTGRDEELLGDRRYRSGARLATDLLARLVTRVDGVEREVDAALVADLLVGDRDYLLLRLRQLAVGDHVHQVMRCPAPGCGERVDVEFRISEIPVRRAERLQARYPFTLSRPAWDDDESSDRGTLRLPTGRDQEAIAELADASPGEANTRLLSRIVLSLGERTGIDEEAARELPLRVRREIGAALERLAPGPDLQVVIQCPHCGADMSYPFDLHDFFLTSGQ
ncbi:MAG TPA: hypothetical protein VEW03_04935 [Longimicrobiaceae bacterium]|nr:hypothetical protein [Longimicrobiaceae bacterium]